MSSIWTASEYTRLVVAWEARMQFLRAGDTASASHYWGEAFRALYPYKGGKKQQEMIEWHKRSTSTHEYADCTVAGIMFFEDTVGLAR